MFIIDEVGKMELYSSSFFPAVLKILESNIPVLASVPIPKSGRDIPGGTFFFFFLTSCKFKAWSGEYLFGDYNHMCDFVQLLG